jgi:hypothetical protein
MCHFMRANITDMAFQPSDDMIAALLEHELSRPLRHSLCVRATNSASQEKIILYFGHLLQAHHLQPLCHAIPGERSSKRRDMAHDQQWSGTYRDI